MPVVGRLPCGSAQVLPCCAGVPYDLTPDFLETLFSKHRIDYVIHGDDPCILPDGTDAYEHAKKMGRFRMVGACPSIQSLCFLCIAAPCGSPINCKQCSIRCIVAL